MQRQLPLSWTETSSNDIEYIHLKLPNAHFIPFATLPETVSLDDFLCHLDQVLNAPIIIRGVPHRAIKMLPGGTYWSFASEAVLRSESFSPSKSLQDLNKRGLRHGTVQEVHSQEGKEHIGTLWNASVYSNSQPFRFLFRHLPSSRDRTFIFRHPTTPRTLAVVFFSQR
ncbi:MAG: hypothetical protein KDD55_10960, partial [Bdellovibrionales bacterium]|nr:hypothetical protein [Bdellovibrionales bacterium]